jgi:hypothetical protein
VSQDCGLGGLSQSGGLGSCIGFDCRGGKPAHIVLILRPTAVVLSIYDSTEDKKPLVSETAALPKSVLMNPLNLVIHKRCLAIDLSIWLAAVGVGWGTLD